MKNNGKKTIVLIILVLIAITLLTLWHTGVISLKQKGISFIANNSTEYNTEGYLVSGEHTISINLDDLDSNIGKELYNDGECKIYVDWIDNTGDINTGGYRIGFRSSGQYSLNGATLVSGIHHKRVSDNVFNASMTAIMTAKYKDKIYNSSINGVTLLNYKDGDQFSFYIFTSEAYDSGEISLDEKGIVELTVKNLYKNIWTKK